MGRMRRSSSAASASGSSSRSCSRSNTGGDVVITAGRTSQEVFQHHGEALGVEDLDAIVADYADDAVFITREGVVRGKDGIRQAFADLLGQIPQAVWDIKSTVFEGDVLLLQHWGAESANTR